MFARLLKVIVVRNSISTSVVGKTREQFVKYFSVSRIHKRSTKPPSSAVEKDTVTSVAKLLKSYEFNDPQIKKFFTKFPINPLYDSTHVIKSKLDFFLDIGFSYTQLAKFISSNHHLLKLSLEKRIKPNVLLLKPFYENQEYLRSALLSSSNILQSKLESNFFPNVRTLANQGVPRANIIKLAYKYPRTLQNPVKKLEKMVQLVATKGFNPRSFLFCTALHLVSGTNPVTWMKKVSLYKSFGWSDDDVVSAFRRYPWCMGVSEKKIKRVMSLFNSNKQFKPSCLAESPVIFGLSLEKRIIPRCLVIEILMKKQLVKRIYMNHYLISNKDFLKKYVTLYQDHAPEILSAYNDLERKGH